MSETIAPFSVLIIVKSRSGHLNNVLAGLERSSRKPDEIIVVHMNESVTTTSSRLNVRKFVIKDGNPLPLARARNYAAAQASYDQLIFLDVDCIPGRETCASLLSDLHPDRLLMADPFYLPQPIEPLSDELFIHLPTLGRPNDLRSTLSFGRSDNFNMFWSLGFAINASTFHVLDGFDEKFTGAYTARIHNLKLFFVDAPIYHQYHESYSPPLNHLADIVYNAIVFHEKWRQWPMSGWLKAFEYNGYINWTDDDIQILDLPTTDEITAALDRQT
jgi:hypothetical protein